MNPETIDASIRKITGSPALLAEAREKVDLVTRLTARLSAEQVYVLLQPLLILFGPPDHGDGPEAKTLDRAWLDLHTQAYRDIPKEALEAAVSDWIAHGKPFFPKPTELVKLADKRATDLRKIAWRLRQAAEKSAPRQRAETTDEQRAAAKARLQEAMGKLASRGLPTVSRASMLRRA